MPQQINRLIIVFAVLIAGWFVGRYIVAPPTFGDLGHFRASAIDSVAVLPIQYAGQQSCFECHDEIFMMKQDSRHNTVSCEACHGPSALHVEDAFEVLPSAPRERGYCSLCHGYDPSRPTGFPQIEPMTHNPLKACIACHDPHQPVTPGVPEECSACHGQIARTKAVSHHAQLACTRCHEADENHKTNPRLVRPSKPRTNVLCGECHAKGVEAPVEIPRIDMVAHGNGYVCWQCHYPHHPEVD